VCPAVEAGVSGSSGRRVWSQGNALLYCFTLATTIGYGHLTPASEGEAAPRQFSCLTNNTPFGSLRSVLRRDYRERRIKEAGN
jgi:hypothetical protein